MVRAQAKHTDSSWCLGTQTESDAWSLAKSTSTKPDGTLMAANRSLDMTMIRDLFSCMSLSDQSFI